MPVSDPGGARPAAVGARGCSPYPGMRHRRLAELLPPLAAGHPGATRA
jgi:hypothetical protein